MIIILMVIINVHMKWFPSFARSLDRLLVLLAARRLQQKTKQTKKKQSTNSAQNQHTLRTRTLDN